MGAALESKPDGLFQRRAPRSLLSFVIASAGVIVLIGAGGGCKQKRAGETEAESQFSGTCARCHGAEGNGGQSAGAGAPAPRNFHDAAFQASRTDADIQRTITQGKPPGMPAFGGMFSDEQMRGLVGVVRSFDPSRQKVASSPNPEKSP